MARLRRALDLDSGHVSVEEAVVDLRGQSAGLRRAGVVLRVGDDGRVRTRPRDVSRYGGPPRLRGRLERREDRVRLVGAVREDLLRVLWPRIWWGTTGFLALCAVLVLAGDGVGGLFALFAASAVALGLAARGTGRHPGAFERDADALERQLREALRG